MRRGGGALMSSNERGSRSTTATTNGNDQTAAVFALGHDFVQASELILFGRDVITQKSSLVGHFLRASVAAASANCTRTGPALQSTSSPTPGRGGRN